MDTTSVRGLEAVRAQLTRISFWLRRSLFIIPGLCVVVAVALSELVVRADRAGAGEWLPDIYETTPENSRSVLGAIATGSITVVTLVLTLTLVAIQLAAGQLSPRTIANFLGDRFQQATVGLVLGTAAYSLLVLRAVPSTSTDTGPSDIGVLLAVGLTILSLLFLVASVDRTANRLAVGNLIQDLAEETLDALRTQWRDDGDTTDEASEVEWTVTGEVAAARTGWLQNVDLEELANALPADTRARIVRRVGTFVFDGMVLLELDREIDEPGSVRAAFDIDDSRTLGQDASYGITRLVDIGLRALSPGINDSNTAREVALRLGQVTLAAIGRLTPETVECFDNGARIEIPRLAHDDIVEAAFGQMIDAARGNRAVLETIHRTLKTIVAEADRRNLPGDTSSCSEMLDRLTETTDINPSFDHPAERWLSLP